MTIAFVHPDLAAGDVRPVETKLLTLWFARRPRVAVNPCLYPEAGWYVQLACHEIAHAKGWRGDHPGGSFMRQPSFVKAELAPEDVLSADAVQVALLAKTAKRP